MSTCIKCGLGKKESEFYWKDAKKTRRSSLCRDCHKTACREYTVNHRSEAAARRLAKIKADPDFDRKNDLRKHYGMSLQDFAHLFEAQRGLCGICKTEQPRGKDGVFHVDHKDVPGYKAMVPEEKKQHVRGLLCNECNQGIGKLKENPTILQAAINYLTQERNPLC